MSNPWLAHVKKTQEANNGMTYKEAMVKAKSTYKAPATGGAKKTPATAKKTPPRAPTPPPMPVKKPVGRPRKHTESKSSVASKLNKQGGTGAYAAEAQAAAAAIGTVGDVSKGVIGAVQTDKASSGRYTKAQFDKRTREVGRLKGLMKKGKWPVMSDSELLKYVEEHY